VVLLHGWGLSGRPYAPVVRALAERGYRAIAPSLAVMRSPWSLDGLAEVAADLLMSLDAAPASLVGHSFGGVVALRAATDFPGLASGLVLVNSLGVSPGRRSLMRTVVPGRHWRVGMQRSTAAALLGSVTRDGGWSSLAGAARWVLSQSLEQELAAIRDMGLPTSVLWGEGDTLLPRRIGERAAELLGCPLRPVGRGDGWPGKRPPDHDWPLRAPSYFADRLTETLVELRRPPRRRSRTGRSGARDA
jgi:pimeloyl-ACP methyl ester carboxylesterase